MAKQDGPIEVPAVEANQVLVTKLFPPPIPPDAVARQALLDRLWRHRHRPCTLISAPVGYGKSTLASMWLAASGLPGAWVSLDENDATLRVFTTYLVAALANIFPYKQLSSTALLATAHLPPVPVLARYLVNDFEQLEEPFLLVLDDIHLIHERAIYDLLNQLLRHPARTMRLVLSAGATRLCQSRHFARAASSMRYARAISASALRKHSSC